MNGVDVGQVEAATRMEAKPAGDRPVCGQDGAGDVWPHDGAAVRERGVGDGELQGGHCEVALPDREVDRIALVPDALRRRAKCLSQPARRGDDAAVLTRKVA